MKKRFVSEKVAAFSTSLSTAVIAGDTLYFSGMLATNPKTGELKKGTAEEETHTIIENLKTMLGELGKDLDCVVMSHCFLSSMEHNDGFGKAYAEHFSHFECPPARRTTISPLWQDCKVEISVIAYLGD